MDDKVKAGIERIDGMAGMCNSFITCYFDQFLQLLKTRGAAIVGVVEHVAARFSVIAMIVCGLLYTVLCLKNMIVSFFFKDAPAKTCFIMAVTTVIALAVCAYVAVKMMDALSKVINSSACKISSLNIFSVMSALGVLLTVASFIGGIYLAIEFKTAQMFFMGLGGAVFFALVTLYAANPEQFGIVADEQASAGEDFVSIYTFLLKVMLRLVPVSLLGLSLLGICRIIPMIFSLYIKFSDGANRLWSGYMMADMSSVQWFVFIGVLPLVVYLVYVFYYVTLDIIRAILQLPNKLDALKK